MTDCSNLRKFIPFIAKDCINRVKAALEHQIILVIFDGTSDGDEVFNIVFRWVDQDFNIVEKLAHLGKYAKTFKSEDLVFVLTNCVMNEYSVYAGDYGARICGNVLGFQRDRAAVNTKAVGLMLQHYQSSLDLHCFAHTMCHVGEKMKTELLEKTKSDICKLLNVSCKAKSIWFYWFKRSWSNPGNTRWWASYKLFVYILSNWSVFVAFVGDVDIPSTDLNDMSIDHNNGACIDRIRERLSNPSSKALLKYELAVIVVVNKHLVEATYNLEGKGAVSLFAYDIIINIDCYFSANADTCSFPDLDEYTNEYARQLVLIAEKAGETLNFNMAKEQAKKCCKQIVQPGIEYFKTTIMDKLKKDVALFKVCRYCNPMYFTTYFETIHKEVFITDVKSAFTTRFNDNDLRNMANEYKNTLQVYASNYYEAPDPDARFADNVDMCLTFWHNAAKRRDYKMPNVFLLVRCCMTLVPSSAASERVFSKLNTMFNDLQKVSYEDNVAACLMLAVNE